MRRIAERFAKNFAKIVVQRGGVKAVAKAVGCGSSTVYSWQTGAFPQDKYWDALETFLGFSITTLFAEPTELAITCIVSADSSQINGPVVLWNQGENLGTLTPPLKDCYVAEVRGSSMDPIVRDRQHLIVENKPAAGGDLALVSLVNGASLFKRLRDRGDSWELESVGAGEKTQRVKKCEVRQTQRVVGVCFY